VTKETFSDLDLIEPLLRALSAKNYSQPTPIQAQAIPPLLAGKDLLGIAQTGTGKTAAFGLPILQQIVEARAPAGARGTRALVLAPTRELAIQIGEEMKAYGRHLNLRQTVIFGGVGQHPQVRALARGVDVLIATPGRLLDLLGQGHLRLDRVTHFVLDEADRMLDMGFIHDVRKVVAKLPKRRHTAFFSATMPQQVARLAGDILNDPLRIEVTPAATTVEKVEQRVFFVETANKRALLADVLKDPALNRVIVFSRTKHGANRIAEQLEKRGVEAAAIHGNKSQGARQRALEGFKSGRVRVLVATDIAARGIDVDEVSHVINFDLPNEPESYVHRIGRTARAGAAGVALSFCDGAERAYLRDIEKLTRQRIEVDAEHRFHNAASNAANDAAPRAKTGRGGPPPSQGRRRRRGGRPRRAA
jgi:ATP-dependent RNA helicase RhlE